MLIGIASIRKPKIDAVRAVFTRLAPIFGIAADEMSFVENEVGSGVEETPISLERILEGARTRGKKLSDRFRSEKVDATYCVGLEGGFFSVKDSMGGIQTFLQSWAFVINGERESYGASGAIIVPKAIARPVIENKESLARVIDRVSLQRDVRNNQGTWGVLSGDRITRQASFESALTNALAPFYNPAVYGNGTSADSRSKPSNSYTT
jgi:inosine/xanthosine triphosphatase